MKPISDETIRIFDNFVFKQTTSQIEKWKKDYEIKQHSFINHFQYSVSQFNNPETGEFIYRLFYVMVLCYENYGIEIPLISEKTHKKMTAKFKHDMSRHKNDSDSMVDMDKAADFNPHPNLLDYFAQKVMNEKNIDVLYLEEQISYIISMLLLNSYVYNTFINKTVDHKETKLDKVWRIISFWRKKKKTFPVSTISNYTVSKGLMHQIGIETIEQIESFSFNLTPVQLEDWLKNYKKEQYNLVVSFEISRRTELTDLKDRENFTRLFNILVNCYKFYTIEIPKINKAEIETRKKELYRSTNINHSNMTFEDLEIHLNKKINQPFLIMYFLDKIIGDDEVFMFKGQITSQWVLFDLMTYAIILNRNVERLINN